MTRIVREAREQRPPGAARRRLAREFAGIAATAPELREVEKQVRELYLIPTTEETR